MKKRIFLLALSALLLVTMCICIFSGCKPTTDPSSETTATPTDTTATPEVTTIDEQTTVPVTEAPPVIVEVTKGGKSSFKLVRVELASEEFISGVSDFNKYITEKTGATLEYTSDFLTPGQSPAEYEILVGLTNREASTDAYNKLDYLSYSISVSDKTIAIVGGCEEQTLLGIEKFKELFVTGSDITLESGYYFKSEAPAYPLSLVTFDGTPLEDFKIVYASKYKEAAKYMHKFVGEATGVIMEYNNDTVEASAHEIILGSTTRKTLPACTEGFTISYDNGKIYLNEGTVDMRNVVYKMVQTMLENGGDGTLKVPASYININYKNYTRAEYIENPDLFIPNWAYEWQAPDGLIPFACKIDRLCKPENNGLFTISHRADFIHYPENSIESIISVWMMGGDCVEIDFSVSKDGVIVLQHDGTLSRMTDFSEKAGKNGLPTSNNVSDWTYEQLMQLNLKTGWGGDAAAVTEYKIASLEEVLKVCKDRLFIVADKPNCWKYVDIADIMPNSANVFLYDVMVKTGNYTSLLISYGTLDTTAANTLSAEQAVRIQKYIFEKSGQAPYMYLRAWTTRATALPYAEYLSDNSLTNSTLLINGAYIDAVGVKNAIAMLLKKYPKARVGGWVIEDATDIPAQWDSMYNAGFRAIMNNNFYALVQHFAEINSENAYK